MATKTSRGSESNHALLSDFHYYLANQAEFAERYFGKAIVIKDRELLGVFDTELEAVMVMGEKHELGTFLVQPVTDGDEEYNFTFNVPVVRSV